MPAAINQRGARHPLIDSGDQLYETPREATLALMRALPLPKRIWEPCAGRGAISRILRGYGYEVTATELIDYPGRDVHVVTGIDFFATDSAPRGCGLIITNPPYKDADAFVRHALTLVPKVVVLLRLAALEGAGRSDLIEGHLTHLWIGIERLPMMHREGWEGPRLKGNGAPFAWFQFERKKLRPAFTARRISWRT